MLTKGITGLFIYQYLTRLCSSHKSSESCGQFWAPGCLLESRSVYHVEVPPGEWPMLMLPMWIHLHTLFPAAHLTGPCHLRVAGCIACSVWCWQHYVISDTHTHTHTQVPRATIKGTTRTYTCIAFILEVIHFFVLFFSVNCDTNMSVYHWNVCSITRDANLNISVHHVSFRLGWWRISLNCHWETKHTDTRNWLMENGHRLDCKTNFSLLIGETMTKWQKLFSDWRFMLFGGLCSLEMPRENRPVCKQS